MTRSADKLLESVLKTVNLKNINFRFNNRAVLNYLRRERMFKIIYPLIFILFLSVNDSYAKADIEIVTEFMPPLQLAKHGQRMTGVTADLVNAVVQDTKLTSVDNVYPWARSYTLAIMKPNVLIFPIIRTKEREKNFHWVGEVWEFSAAIYSNKNNINISTLEEAKNYNISVYRDDFFHNYLLDQGFSPEKLFPVTDIEQSIQLFINGRVDLIIIDSSIFEFYVNRSNKSILDYQKLVVLDDIKENHAFIALSKSTPLKTVNLFIESFKRISEKRNDIKLK